MNAFDVLNKIILEECEENKGFYIAWDEDLEWDDSNVSYFDQWHNGIMSMQEWMNVTCENEFGYVKILWD